VPHPFVVFAKGWDGFAKKSPEREFQFEIGNFRLKRQRNGQEKGAGKMPAVRNAKKQNAEKEQPKNTHPFADIAKGGAPEKTKASSEFNGWATRQTRCVHGRRSVRRPHHKALTFLRTFAIQ
jgi:hypothetical protein